MSEPASVTKVDWDIPDDRRFLARLVGPGASAAELWLQFTFALGAAAALLTAAIIQRWGWSVTQLTVVAILAFDVAGGIVTNTTSAGKRWYHRPGRTTWHHFRFVALHGCHLAVVAVAFFPSANQLALLGCSYLLACAALQLSVPVYLRRPVAAVQTTVVIVLAVYVFDAPPHLEWVLPGLSLKLLMGYLPVEAPFARSAAPV
ncbi:hypothetical protein ACQUZK_08790 [Streptococcus pyogenes]|uniref:hypothetical protein n=1 Tax=Streptococcus pyogenes TaxID=1314 RepID=UPI003DA0FBB5